MKTIFRYSILLLAVPIAAALFTACDDNELNGDPRIDYIRVTDPASSDSLIVTAGQGQMVAIMGENLGGATQLWFNDQKASLTPTLVTNRSIIARIPTEIPQTVNNKLTLIFGNGSSLEHDFVLDISEPLVTRMKSEYVNTGETATIYGDFFYKPITVTFTGGVQAEITDMDDQMIEVEVPEGAQPGPITISSNFGSTISDFWFRDNRNIIAGFDNTLSSGVWRGPDYIFAADPVITPVSGKFVRVNRALSAWPFFELYGGPREGDIGKQAKNIPDEAIINPAAYSLKFEINTLESLTGATMRLHIGNADNGGLDAARQSSYYTWNVNLNTGGEWQTVSIPFADVYKGFARSAEGYSMFIYFHGPNAVKHNFALDNLRVVPNTND
ncbi:MAG TPA: glycan-binding surface protein [Chryseosolibacter sp.]